MKPKTVLVVDDHRDAADMVAMMIRVLGHRAIVAYDTATGLQLAAQSNPDVIIHDIGMPIMNGYLAAAELRRDPNFKTTLLVALTAYATTPDRERSQREGFDMHVTKPIDVEVLDEILNRSVD